ncbi:MAG: hypothetical protein M1820_004169 [Bogoriella megaspora]|nr:MAG: hypothetical protein M1820_004169 [Bogoriella megaspora]
MATVKEAAWDYIEKLFKFDCNDLSDFTVTCSGRKWRVHKLVLCAQSSYFQKLCTGEFEEAAKGIADLKGEEPDEINTMLEFCYTCRYTDDNVAEADRMPLAIRTIITADKYEVLLLKEQAVERFRNLARGPPAGDGFSRAVRLIYDNALDNEQDEIQSLVIELANAQYDTLMRTDDGFKTLLEEYGAFSAATIAQIKASTSSQDKSWQPFSCPQQLDYFADLRFDGCPFCSTSQPGH